MPKVKSSRCRLVCTKHGSCKHKKPICGCLLCWDQPGQCTCLHSKVRKPVRYVMAKQLMDEFKTSWEYRIIPNKYRERIVNHIDSKETHTLNCCITAALPHLPTTIQEFVKQKMADVFNKIISQNKSNLQ